MDQAVNPNTVEPAEHTVASSEPGFPSNPHNVGVSAFVEELVDVGVFT